MLRFVLPLLLVGCLARIEDTRQEEKDAALLTNRLPNNQGHGALQNAICTGCTDLFTEVKAFLNNPDMIERLKGMLRQVCPYFGGAEEDCINLINDDLISLIHQLQPLLDNPEKVCKDLELCSEGRMSYMYAKKFVLQYGKRFMTKLRTGSAVLCDECQFILKEAKTVWDDNATQAEIKSYLLNACSALGSFEDECKDLVSENFDKIVEMVDMVLNDPKSACAQLGLCTTERALLTSRFYSYHQNLKTHAKNVFHPSKVPHLAQLVRRINEKVSRMGSRAGCLTCEFFMRWLEAFLINDNILNNLSNEIRQICPKLPDDVDKQCDDWLGIYLPAILNMTVQTYLKPEEVCTVLTACTKSEAARFTELMTSARGGRLACDACEATFNMLKMELKRQAFQKELEGALERLICDKINPDYKDKCNEMIDGYFPQIWQILDDAINAEAICKDLKACN